MRRLQRQSVASGKKGGRKPPFFVVARRRRSGVRSRATGKTPPRRRTLRREDCPVGEIRIDRQDYPRFPHGSERASRRESADRRLSDTRDAWPWSWTPGRARRDVPATNDCFALLRREDLVMGGERDARQRARW